MYSSVVRIFSGGVGFILVVFSFFRKNKSFSNGGGASLG